MMAWMSAASGLAWYYGDAGNDTLTMGRQRNIRQFFGGDGIDTVNYLFPSGVARGISVTVDDQFGDGYFAQDNVHHDVEACRFAGSDFDAGSERLRIAFDGRRQRP